MLTLAELLSSTSAFTAVEMTDAINMVETPPLMLGNMGERLFRTRRVRTRMFAMQRKGNAYTLVPDSPVGAPPVELEVSGRDLIPFRTGRMAKGSTILAEMLNGVLQEPLGQALRSIAQETADRQAQIMTDFEVTFEHMRLGAVMGKVLDADGVTVLHNWYTSWDVPEPTPIDFDLDTSTTNIRAKLALAYDAVVDNAEGAWVTGAEVHALAGRNFFDKLVSHPNLEKFWLNTPEARALLQGQQDDISLGNITFHKYRGSSDGTTLAVDTDTAWFFPVGTDAFYRFQGPGEFAPFIQEQGRDFYSIMLRDPSGRDAWIRPEVYSYPLFMCRRPKMIAKGAA